MSQFLSSFPFLISFASISEFDFSNAMPSNNFQKPNIIHADSELRDHISLRTANRIFHLFRRRLLITTIWNNGPLMPNIHKKIKYQLNSALVRPVICDCSYPFYAALISHQLTLYIFQIYNLTGFALLSPSAGEGHCSRWPSHG